MSRRADAPQAQFNLPAAGTVALVTAALFIGVLLLGARAELPALVVATVAGFVLLGLYRPKR